MFYVLFGDETVVATGGGYSQKNLVGMCSPFPKTFTLFMTKVWHFPYPIYDQPKSSIPSDTVALNIIFEGLLFMVLWNSSFFLKTYLIQD